jgi:hypothetical protein
MDNLFPPDESPLSHHSFIRYTTSFKNFFSCNYFLHFVSCTLVDSDIICVSLSIISSSLLSLNFIPIQDPHFQIIMYIPSITVCEWSDLSMKYRPTPFFDSNIYHHYHLTAAPNIPETIAQESAVFLFL